MSSLLLATSASAVTVDLIDGNGTLDWNTGIGVSSMVENAAVTHPLFANNRHTREGWFLYLEDFAYLHEFTNFTKAPNGASQDSISSTFTHFTGESFTLDLTYGINAVGPDGLPDLTWSGQISRPLNPASPFPILSARLFNIFDYDVGDILGNDSVVMNFPTGATVIEIAGPGGITGFRGSLGTPNYTADTLTNVLAQILGPAQLNNIAAPGNYDMVGAFQWNYDLCSGPGVAPGCTGSGSGSGGFGGFGGFGASGGGPVPEPSAGLLVLGGLTFLAHNRRARAA
ncbi:MAG: PEP-CTERM sorting domain-containing protein [bacterium]|nr:PEP-CTERM sorting domain-containing protein [bacterium]